MARKESFNVLAITLILLGFLLIMDLYDIIPGIMIFWPFIIFVIGIGFCLLFYRKKRKDLVLLGLGTFLTLCSIFFAYLNIIGWKSLLYLWPMFPAILGLTFIPPYVYSRKSTLLSLGVFLIGLGLSFILIFTISTMLWPSSLIIAGGSFLIIGNFGKKKGKTR